MIFRGCFGPAGKMLHEYGHVAVPHHRFEFVFAEKFFQLRENVKIELVR